MEAVGPHVDEFKPGDHVIACLSVFCGHCEYCLTGRTHLCQSRPVRATNEPPKLTWNGAPVNQFANLSSYAEQMLVHDSGLVKVRDDMPLDRGALIGCGVTTGVGAVLNTARVEPGTTVVVFGAGGVGLAAIQGAVIAGARMIIAVDVVGPQAGDGQVAGRHPRRRRLQGRSGQGHPRRSPAPAPTTRSRRSASRRPPSRPSNACGRAARPRSSA